MNKAIKISIATAFILNLNLIANDKKEIKLETVVVSASGFEQSILEAPATIEVISKEHLQNVAYKGITDALDDIAGISIEGGSGKVDNSSVSIRGFSEEYTLFMVDGKSQGSSQAYYNGFGGGAESNWLPPVGAIERIEVVKGPMSSLYGSEAVGGVINIITKKIPDKPTGSVTTDFVIQENNKAGDTKQVKYYFASPLIENTLGFAFYGSYFDRAEDKFKNGFKKKNKRDNTVKFNYKFADTQSLELLLGYAKGKSLGTAEKTGAATMDNDRRNYALTHEITWLKDIKTTSFLTHENVHIKNGNNISAYKRSSFNTKSVIPFERNMLTLGADYRKEQTNHAPNRFHGKMSSPNLKRWQGALFVENEFIATDDLYITTGLRWDKNEHYGNEFVPRIYAVYRINDFFSLKGGVGKGYKAPTLKQADPNIGEQSGGRGQNIDIGNYSLKPETSLNYEIGLAYDDNKFGADAMVFYTDFKDRIGREVICSTGCIYNGKRFNQINEYKNVSKAEIKGLELNLKYNFDNIKTKFNYTYSKSENKTGTSKGTPFYNVPTHMANFSIDAKIYPNLTLWSKVKYKGKTQETISRGVASRTPAYTITDIGIKYKLSKNFDIFGGVYNLFDKDVTVDDGFGKQLDGRRYNVGFTASF